MTFAGEFLGLPGLRGYWPMSAFDSSGNAIDQSGNARTLSSNGNPTYNVHAAGGPYLDLDGDYLTRTDEAGFDILGTEAYVAGAALGLTLGGWFWFDALTVDEHLIGKLGASGQFSYRLDKENGNTVRCLVSGNGTATTTVASATVSTSTWYFLAGRFDPSTELALFVNTTKTTNVTSIPAAIFNSTAAFRIGNDAGSFSQFLNGRAGMCFLCAMALSDTAVDNIYQGTRDFYGI